MNDRAYFLITAMSGMVGMLALIALNLCKYWIENNPVDILSDEGIDQISNIALTMIIAQYLSLGALVVFVIFLVLFLVSRSTEKSTGQ